MSIPEEILTTAKEAMRRFGGHLPMLFVQGTKGKVFILLPFGETYAQRVDIMTQAGIQFAKSNKIGNVERVIFVSEAWASPARDGGTQMPSQDPNRFEVLLFNSLDARTGVQELEMYACIRNGKQDIIDLKSIPMPKDRGQVKSQLLPSFLAGYRLFKR